MREVLESKTSEAPLVSVHHATKKQAKKFLFHVAIAFGVLFLLLLLLFVITRIFPMDSSPQNSPNSDEPLKECTSNGCMEAGRRIASMANFEADPCSDFHQFACGNFQQAYPPPNNGKTWTMYKVVEKNIKQKLSQLLLSRDLQRPSAVVKTYDYYQTCVDSAPLNFSPLLEVVRKVGGWPLLGEEGVWSESKWKLQDSIQVALSYQCFPLLRLKLTLAGNPPTPLVFPPAFTVTKAGAPEAAEAFKQHVVAMLKRLGKEDLKEEGLRQIEEMWMFEKDLINIAAPNKASKTVSEVDALLPDELKLTSLMASYFQSHITEGAKVNVNENYVKNLVSILRRHPAKVQANYVAWSVVRSVMSEVESSFESADAILERIQNGPPPAKPPSEVQKEREEKCLQSVINNFEYTIGTIFVKKYFDVSVKRKGEDMCARLIEAAKKHPPHFFDRETIEKAREKLSKMKCAVGYPSFILEDQKLDQFYEKYMSGSNFLENTINQRLFATNLAASQYGNKFVPQHWLTSPVTVNAFVFSLINQLTICAGIFQPPLFYPDTLPEMTWGSVGVTMAHELSHSYLPPGTKFDAEGEEKEWWTTQSNHRFKPEEKCFIETFGKLKMFNQSINGKLTVKESMADAGGLWMAFRSLLDEYGGGKKGWKALQLPTTLPGVDLNRAQLFFVSYAQKLCSLYNNQTSRRLFNSPHTFNHIRMQGTLQNSKEFATVFKCPSGGPYNPAHKCSIFKL